MTGPAGPPPGGEAADGEAAAAERLFRRPCRFLRTVPHLDDLPADGPPEVCFGGRSNCGKSSLLNALVDRRGLARASGSPGRTRALNYFDLGGVLWLVDLPGYGYARASIREARAWGRLVEAYLRSRRNLRRAYVLVDARRGIGALDHTYMSLLDEAGISHRTVATKMDKIRPSRQGASDAALEAALAAHPAARAGVLRTSATRRSGLEALRRDILDAAGLAGGDSARD